MSGSSLLACRPRMFHCNILVIVITYEGLVQSDSEELPSSASVYNELNIFRVGISESDLGGLVSLGFFFPLSGVLPCGLLKLFLVQVKASEGLRVDVRDALFEE